MPLPWFRRQKADEQAPARAAAEAPTTTTTDSTTPVEQPLEAPAVSETARTTDEAAAEARKRRRGTRGGRNRRKKPAEGAAADTAAEEDAPTTTKVQSQRAEKKAAERKGRTQPRRRQAPKRAPLPKAKRELLVSVDAGEKRVAVLEDDQVVEVYLERPERRSIAGDIYLGVVDNVLPGMEAAFVEIGLEKNGFLYVDEIVGPELEGRKGARKIQDLIQRGQTVLVQAVKDPMKTKGARLTTEISLPGRFVVYVPHGEGLGVSRRLEDDERNRLKGILKECAPKKGGVIVRTAAEGASAEDVERDLDFLQRLWTSIEERARTAKAPSLVYQEAELPLRVVRDLFTGDFERLLVDHDRTHKRIVGYLKKTSPHMAERVTRYKEREPLMEAFGVEAEIKSTLNRRVDLPSGGYLIFDYAEAFTVVDVNTGRFVGSRSKKSGARLEDTITKNNLEAVKEVVRQLRLRDIGGIIVIDFIDMANPKNRQQVEDALREELERDRTKTYVVEISPLGLVEMTRQNVTDGPREVMTKKCPTCGGDGIVVSDNTAAVDVERRLRSLVTPGSRDKAFKVEVNAKIASLVVGPGATRLQELEETTKRRFFLVGKEGVHLDHFRVLAQGTLEKVAPSLPVDVGQELELKLGELGLHDSHAGVGKVDGVDVVVAGAAKLVGKKVTARVTAVTEDTAWAELLSPLEETEPPLTAEAEAEKPTRARRPATRKKVEGAEEAAADDAAVTDQAEEADEAGSDADETSGEVELNEDGTPKKKRTRRGSRGGRNRRKKPAGEPGDEAEADAVAEGDPDDGGEAVEAVEAAAADAPSNGAAPRKPRAPRAPRIHVPDRALGAEDEDDSADGEASGEVELNEDGTPKKKRTRRGSRGGRNRRKKPPTEAEATGDEQTVAAAVATVATGGADASEDGAPADDEPVAVEEPAETEAVLQTEDAPAEDAPADEEPEPEPEAMADEPSGNGSGDWGYTPMSDWGLDDE